MTLLRRRLTWFRAAALLALAIAAAGALTPPVASVVSRTYRVWRAFPVAPGVETYLSWSYTERAGPGHERYDVGGLDPWGHRWRRRDAYQGWSVWSKGPDGVDDGGGGDDVPVDPRAAHVELAPAASIAAALLLLWLAAALRALARPRGPELWAEAGRALFVASVPAAGLALLVRERGLPDLLERGPPLLVPREVAAVGAAWLVLALATLGWRVRGGARRGRLPVRLRPLLLVALFAVLAAFMAERGREGVLARRAGEGRLALALAGDAPSFGAVCSKGEPGQLDALMAAAPSYRSIVRIDDAGVRALARFGPAANRYLLGNLLESDSRWGSKSDPRLSLTHLVRHDPELATLTATLQAQPRGWGSNLTAVEPLLAAALRGWDADTLRYLRYLAFAGRSMADKGQAALHALLVLRDDPALPRTRRAVAALDPGELADLEAALTPWLESQLPGDELDEFDDERRGLPEPAPLVRAAPPPLPDVWLLVAVTGLADPEGLELRLGEARVRAARLELEPHLFVVGPLEALPDGTTLGLAAAGRRAATRLPGLGEGGAVWIQADLATGQATARRLRDGRL